MCEVCSKSSRREFLKGSTSAATIALAPQVVMADITDFPGVVTRDQWSLVPPASSPGSSQQYALSEKPRYVSVHYTAFFAKHPRFGTRDLVRNLQTGHIDRGYGDIAYHFIVTLPGEIYEGRPLSIAPASGTYYHSEADLAEAVYRQDGRLAEESIISGMKPGHTENHITVSFNVGIGEPTELPEEVMQKGARLIARLLFENGLTPEDVRAHREFANSTCPGDAIYSWLRGPNMRRDEDGPGMILIRQEFEFLAAS